MKVSDVTFSRTAILTINVSEDFLNDVIELLNSESAITVVGETEYKAPNKGAQIVHVFQGMHDGTVEFADRKEIAKAINCSPASVSTVLSDANKKGIDWAVSYLAKDAEQGELAAAKRKMAEFEKMMQKHPDLAEYFKAKMLAESAGTESAGSEELLSA